MQRVRGGGDGGAFKVNAGDEWEFTDSTRVTPGTNGRLILAVKLRHESDPLCDRWLRSAPVHGDSCATAGEWTGLRVRVAVPAGGYRVAEVFAEFDGHTTGEWFLGGLAAKGTAKVPA